MRAWKILELEEELGKVKEQEELARMLNQKTDLHIKRELEILNEIKEEANKMISIATNQANLAIAVQERAAQRMKMHPKAVKAVG